jgi:hypothetical protein
VFFKVSYAYGKWHPKLRLRKLNSWDRNGIIVNNYAVFSYYAYPNLWSPLPPIIICYRYRQCQKEKFKSSQETVETM